MEKSCDNCRFTALNNRLDKNCTEFRRKLNIYKHCDKNYSEWQAIEYTCPDCLKVLSECTCLEVKEGIKNDQDKLLVGLMLKGFACPLLELAKVVTFGAKKYGKFNWQKVNKERYQEALARHYMAWLDGEKLDQETNVSHLAHLSFNVLAILYFELNENKNEK